MCSLGSAAESGGGSLAGLISIARESSVNKDDRERDTVTRIKIS
jgi:hypothetical protein